MSAFTTKEDSDILALYGQVCDGNDTTWKKILVFVSNFGNDTTWKKILVFVSNFLQCIQYYKYMYILFLYMQSKNMHEKFCKTSRPNCSSHAGETPSFIAKCFDHKRRRRTFGDKEVVQ